MSRNFPASPDISTTRLKTAGLVILSAVAAWGQIGSPYPYPYPRGGAPVPGIPMPRRQSKTTKDKPPEKVLPSFQGTLKRFDNKSIVLEMDDFRVLDFKRTDKTKFLKNGDEIKPAEFQAGDRITIEGEEDAEANLTAVNVHWEKKGDGKPAKADDGPTEEQIAAAEKAQDAARQSAAAKTQEAAVPSATELKPPPAPRDPDDPGPPKLQRGKPPARHVSPAQRDEEAPSAASAPVQSAAVTNPPAPPGGPALPATAPSVMRGDKADDESLPTRPEDALIRKAQETALEFTETLPNYVCQEMMTRFYSEASPVSWRPIDVVTTEVVYENGKEDYRNLAINGKPVKKGMEELSGAWSTGEFGTVLIDLFSPATNADFRFRRESRTAGISARMYDFEVLREGSHWLVRTGSQGYQPAYSGSVWIDPKTARVLRIEMQARNLPEEFPLDKVESATDYEYVRLGGTQQFLLPVHAETLSCQRGTMRCSRNTIDFRNYHKYAGESTVEFGQQQTDPQKNDQPKQQKKK